MFTRERHPALELVDIKAAKTSHRSHEGKETRSDEIWNHSLDSIHRAPIIQGSGGENDRKKKPRYNALRRAFGKADVVGEKEVGGICGEWVDEVWGRISSRGYSVDASDIGVGEKIFDASRPVLRRVMFALPVVDIGSIKGFKLGNLDHTAKWSISHKLRRKQV